MAQNWLIDPTTRDYVMEDGAPVETDSLLVPAFHRLRIQQGSWMYQPDDRYGSRFSVFKKRETGGDMSDIENVALIALQPILDDGRASQIGVEATSATRHTVGLKAVVIKARGTFDQFEIPSLGI